MPYPANPIYQKGREVEGGGVNPVIGENNEVLVADPGGNDTWRHHKTQRNRKRKRKKKRKKNGSLTLINLGDAFIRSRSHPLDPPPTILSVTANGTVGLSTVKLTFQSLLLLFLLNCMQ